MINSIISKDLIIDIERIIGKTECEITEDDLNGIIKIALNCLGGIKKDYTIKDLKIFNNLQTITLSGFKITNSDVDILNSIKSLNFVNFDFCDFYCDRLELKSNIEYVVFNVCKLIDISNLYLSAKSIKIIGSEIDKGIIDVSKFNSNTNLGELFLNNFTINNIADVTLKFSNLTKLNIDGSAIVSHKIDNFKNIKFSHNDVFARANL